MIGRITAFASAYRVRRIESLRLEQRAFLDLAATGGKIASRGQHGPDAMRFSVLIATYNRAPDLEDTLIHLAQVTTRKPWEVIVIDNNSTDTTRHVVDRLGTGFPVPLRYQYEPVHGKYRALNSGIRTSQGSIVVATDDDARVAPDWLDRAEAGLEAHSCDFVGGPVRPLWDAPVPSWLDPGDAAAQKVIAISDYGSAAREYGKGIGWPLGVNVAYRRDVFDRVGFFDPSLGRTAGTLRSQSQREWHLRARAARVRGFYVPDMIVWHRVAAERMTKQYFRRWQYWQGISRASLYWRYGFDPEEPEALRHHHPLPGAAGVPRHLVAKAARSARSCVWQRIKRNDARAFAYEMWLWFFAGFFRECLRLRRTPFGRSSPDGLNVEAHSAQPGLVR